MQLSSTQAALITKEAQAARTAIDLKAALGQQAARATEAGRTGGWDGKASASSTTISGGGSKEQPYRNVVVLSPFAVAGKERRAHETGVLQDGMRTVNMRWVSRVDCSIVSLSMP